VERRDWVTGEVYERERERVCDTELESRDCLWALGHWRSGEEEDEDESLATNEGEDGFDVWHPLNS
ncbi:hypothetical protein Ancab_001814, partial [Ancistrocladus abbreviatus]